MKNIEFKSTRSENTRASFWQSLIKGLADDGGLLVPTSFPKISDKILKSKNFWINSKPADFAYNVLRLFVPHKDVSDADLKRDVDQALNFPMPLEKVSDNDFVLRIDRGRTASFKDVAARTLGKLMDRYAKTFNKKLNIVVATSGDTGVAIADAFGGSKNITVTVMYPAHGVSSIQEKQMVEVHHKYENEQVIPILGNFDNCQDIAKLLQIARNVKANDKKAVSDFAKSASQKLKISVSEKDALKLVSLVSTLDLSSANSINIWRLLPQTTQYFTSYGALVKAGKIKVGEKIFFSVPTGNVGHLMAGIYARELGLPVAKFIIGTNTNNILANIIGEGVVRHRPFTNSSAPSMDILDPSNLERLIHFSAEKVGQKSKIDFDAMKHDIKNIKAGESLPLSKYGVSEEILKFIRTLVWAEDVETDDEIFAMMERVYRKEKVVLEPHGTTGYIAVVRARSKGILKNEDKVVIFETAHPDKFPNSLEAAGLLKAKRVKHSTLSCLEKMDLKKMGVPKAEKIGLLNIARGINNLAKEQG